MAISYYYNEKKRKEQEKWLKDNGLWEAYQNSGYKTMTWFIKSLE